MESQSSTRLEALSIKALGVQVCYDLRREIKAVRYAELSSTLKSVLIFFLICGVASLAGAQPQRRPKPAPKKPAAADASRDKDTEADAQQDAQKAAALFDEGQTAHQAGKLEEAVRLYGEAIERDPSLWQAEFQRGAAYLSLNRLPEARDSIKHVLEQLAEFPDSPELRAMSAKAQITLGEILLAGNNPSEAEPAFRRALELQPEAGRAHAGLARVFFAAGKFNEAAGEARAAVRAGDDRATSHALLGAALVSLRKYDEALASLDEALKREPQNAVALRYHAEVFVARKDLPRAAADLQASLNADKNTVTMLRLAEVYAQAGKSDEAVRLARQVLEIEPSNNAARNLIAAATVESSDAREAIAQLEAMLKAEPNRADVRAQLAEKYLPAQPDKALEQYAAAAKLEPDNLNHQIGVGSALVKLRRFQEAAELLRRVLGQNPKPELAYFAHTNLATALFELDDYPNAAREYLWILNHQTDQKKAAVTLFLLGICFDKLGDFEQALKAYEQFLKIAPPENQLEIDKVKLRLEPLKRQLEKSRGKRKK